MKEWIPLVAVPAALVVAIMILKPPYITPRFEHDSAAASSIKVAPYSAPTVAPSELAGFAPLRRRSGTPPILLFHGINNNRDTYSISQRQFALDLALLQRLGYHSISIAQYAAWRAGKKVILPSRPILIAFNDGRIDSWQGADQVLAKYHMRAAMFIIARVTRSSPSPFYLGWDQLKTMQESGRWDIQPKGAQRYRMFESTTLAQLYRFLRDPRVASAHNARSTKPEGRK
jgi:hypothetical protein